MRSSFGMYDIEAQLGYLQSLTRHCPCNLLPEQTSNKHEYSGNFEATLWRHPWRHHHVFDISKCLKWSPFWAHNKHFYRKLYKKLNIPEIWPLTFPTFWAFERRSSSNIDGNRSISKFDLLCDIVTSSMTSWICIYTNVVMISWYLCTGSLMMISLLGF